MTTDSSSYEFIMRVLRAFAMYPNDNNEDLIWRTDGQYASVTFMVNCSDTFCWATADSEFLTPENIDVLEQCQKDLAKLKLPGFYVSTLFAARVRGMRPMRAAYPLGIPELCALYDACGPERDPKTEG